MLDGLHFSAVHLPWHCIFQTTIYRGVWSPGFVYPVSISGLLPAPPSLIAVQPIPVSLLQAAALPICVAQTCTWKTGVLHLHHIAHTTQLVSILIPRLRRLTRSARLSCPIRHNWWIIFFGHFKFHTRFQNGSSIRAAVVELEPPRLDSTLLLLPSMNTLYADLTVNSPQVL